MMSRGGKIVVVVIVLVVVLPVIGYLGLRYYERWQHPSPPEGAFPDHVGKLKIVEYYSRTVASVREDAYIRHQADYEIPQLVETKINYKLLIYSSGDQANAALEADAKKMDNQYETATWEDRFNGSGEKLGRLLVESTIREGSGGYCSLSYVKGAMLIQAVSHSECESAKQFLKDLPRSVQ